MVRLIFVPVILAAMVLPLYSAVVEVLPVVETESVAGTGDVADDAAIWIHPVDRELSRVIGHSKDSGGGLHVYNLAGEEVQFVEIGKVGNLDVGYNFTLGGVLLMMLTGIFILVRKMSVCGDMARSLMWEVIGCLWNILLKLILTRTLRLRWRG